MGRQTRKWSSKMPIFISFAHYIFRIFIPKATHSICVKLLHKHDKLTQCCRAFTLALARLSCSCWNSNSRRYTASICEICIFKFASICCFWTSFAAKVSIPFLLSSVWTRKLCYHKDDCVMHLIYDCPESFWMCIENLKCVAWDNGNWSYGWWLWTLI